MQKLRESKGLKKLPFPDCYYASAAEYVLILDNLKEKGFEVIKKKPERRSFWFKPNIVSIKC